MKFAVCYEDRMVGNTAAKNTLGERSSGDYVKSAVNWLNENWFQDDSYLRLDSRPVLGVFGPMHLRGNWTPLFNDLKIKPMTLGLGRDHLKDDMEADRTFTWISTSGGQSNRRPPGMTSVGEPPSSQVMKQNFATSKPSNGTVAYTPEELRFFIRLHRPRKQTPQSNPQHQLDHASGLLLAVRAILGVPSRLKNRSFIRRRFHFTASVRSPYTGLWQVAKDLVP